MAMTMKKVSVILPVYNEAAALPEFTRRLFDTLGHCPPGYVFEVIYSTDKSTDGTEAVLHELSSRFPLKALFLSRRFGHQASLVAAMDQCDGDAVIMMDCDLQHPPELIPVLLERFEAGFDVVHTVRHYEEDASWFARLTSKLFYRLLRRVSDLEMSDACADFRLISRPVLEVFQRQIREQNPFLRGLFHWVGFRQCKVSFTAASRRDGKSKYNLRKRLRFALTGLVSFSRRPLRWAVGIGALVCLLSFACALYVAVDSLRSGVRPPAWTALIVVLLFLGGVQLVFMGILGEYLGAVFDETKRRPLYLIERVLTSGPASTGWAKPAGVGGSELPPPTEQG